MRFAIFALTVLGALSGFSARGVGVVALGEMAVGVDSGADKTIAEQLRTRLVDAVMNCRKFEVVERSRLKDVLKEQALVDAGLTDGKGPESNKLKAAGYLVYGTIIRCKGDSTASDSQPFKSASMEFQLRLANGETGKLLATKTVKGAAVVDANVDLKEAFDKAMVKVATDSVNHLIELAYPTKVLSVNSHFVTINLTAEQCKEGDLFEVFEVGDELIDEDTGASLGFDEDLMGRVKVSRPGPKVTKCEVCDGLKLDDVKKGMILRRVSKDVIQKENATSARSLRSLR